MNEHCTGGFVKTVIGGNAERKCSVSPTAGRTFLGEIIDRNPEFIDERTLEDIEVNEQDYILLPTQYDIHEYQIMKDFALECPYEQMRDRMLASLRGSGAFRRFKDAVYYLGIRDDWFAYRTKRFSEIAEQWCIQNGLL